MRAATFLLLAALYLLLSGQTGTDECIAALSTAMVAAVVAELLRRTSGRAMALQATGWGRLIGSTIRDLVGDVGRVGMTLAAPHPSDGTFERRPCGDHADRVAQYAGWRGAVVLAASLAPNSFVVAVLPAHRQLLVHRLVPPASTEHAP